MPWDKLDYFDEAQVLHQLEEDYETGMISLALKRIVEDMDALQDREVKL